MYGMPEAMLFSKIFPYQLELGQLNRQCGMQLKGTFRNILHGIIAFGFQF